MPENSAIYTGTDWRTRAGKIIGGGTNPPPELPPLWPGHRPFEVLVGMNAPDGETPGVNGAPNYYEAEQILGSGYVGRTRRMFSGSPATTGSTNNLLSPCDARDQLPVISFKVNNEWDAVANGQRDSWLAPIRTVAASRRVANGGNGKPFLVSLHHEPNGDGPAGMSLLTALTWWGRMNAYLCNYLTGWASRGWTNSGGTYNASEDVRDICRVAPIANGFWWGTKFYYPDRIAAAFPPEIIAILNDRGGPIMADHYDPTLANVSVSYDANNYRIENSIVFPTNYDRSWRQIQTMCDWARANGVNSIGFGETGNINQANWQLSIDTVMANRDIIAIFLAFNNLANSKWDWRLVTTGWGFTGPGRLNPTRTVDGITIVDYGGDPLSAAYIVKYKNLVDRSLTETDPF